MARLATSGFEFQVLGGAAVAESADFRTVGSPAVETTVVRSGAAAMKVSAATQNGRWDQSIANGTASYLRAYVRFDGTPTGDVRILTVQTSTGTNIAHVRMSAGGTTLTLRDRSNVQIGSASSALSANTWYRVSLMVKLAASSPGATNGTAELQVDGVSIASASNIDLASTAQARFLVGQSVATTPGANFYFDDVAINDDTGANQNTWPGPGKIVLLKPVSDDTRDASWLNGASGTTSLFDAVDNRPPVGVAAASATATSQIRSSVANTTDRYIALTDTYSSKGITSADRINVVVGVANYGGAASGQGLSLSLQTNPADAAAVGSVTTSAAAGTYPSNWLTVIGNPSYAPSLTLSSGSKIAVQRNISGGELFVDLMGVYVEYTSPISVSITPATETDAAQALSHGKQRSVTPAAETDTAQALAHYKQATLTAASETDAAQALAHAKQRGITPATETDTAQSLTAQKRATAAPASETDTAQGLTAAKRLGVTPAAETDTAQALTFRQAQTHSITPAVETDTAQALGFTKPIHKDLTPATETDTAQQLSLTRPIYRSITPALETDEAQALSVGAEVAEPGGWLPVRRRIVKRPHLVTIAPAYEFDTAQPLTYRKTPSQIQIEDDELLLLL